MVDTRNRILDIVRYLESCGITVNISKNKARGNKGFFEAKKQNYRIDIAKDLSEEVVYKTLVHEFAHFIHYNYDKTLKNLNFIFEDFIAIEEELLAITVELLPKKSVEPILKKRDEIKNKISELKLKLLEIQPYLTNEYFKKLERRIKKSEYKYLLKHDKVKVFGILGFNFYTISSLKGDDEIELYLILKSKQRELNRLNSKISRLNRYYNSKTELFARSFEMYILNKDKLKELAPRTLKYYEEALNKNKVPLITNFVNLLK